MMTICPGTRADIEGAASLAAVQEAQSVVDEGVVGLAEIGLSRGPGIGFDFARIIHHFGFRNARKIEKSHRESVMKWREQKLARREHAAQREPALRGNQSRGGF